MVELPLEPAAQRVLDEVTAPDGMVTADRLRAVLEAEPTGMVAALLPRTDVLTGAIDRALLVESAAREAEVFGDVAVRCEHLLLGWWRSVDDPAAAARAEFQQLRAEWAFAQYEKVSPHPPLDGDRPLVILVAGVPGTGKSTLAEGLGRALTVPVFSMDWQLGALAVFGVLRPDNSGPVAEMMLTAAIARQLHLGMGAVIDATGHTANERGRWHDLTERLGGRFLGVECVCSDGTVHRSRVEGRSRDIPCWPATVSWEHVLLMRSRWEPWTQSHLVVDSAAGSPEAGLRQVMQNLP